MSSPSSRSRILLITRNLPPLVGGMERLNWHMAEELAKVADVRVVGPEGAAAMAPTDVPVREAPLKPLWKFLLRARVLARREARAWKPDIVLAGSGLTAPLARAAARTCGAKTAVYVHGLDVAVQHPVYRAIWIPALRRMDRVIANSRATAALCRDIGIDPARIGIVHPGVDLPAGGPEGPTPAATASQTAVAASAAPALASVGSSVGGPEGPTSVATASQTTVAASAAPAGGVAAVVGGPEGPTSVATASQTTVAASAAPTGGVAAVAGGSEGLAGFRQRHHLAARPLLLSVGRLSARKGLREFVTLALPQIVAMHPDAMLLVVGDAPKDALHAEAQTPDSIRAAAAQAGVADNLRFLGIITDYQELGVVYRAADVHVFPVREIPGDPEGFGMVAVEAAAHGLPTVAFATGGVPDAVVEGETGSLVPAGDYPAFVASVNDWLACADRVEIAARCMAAAEAFSWGRFGESLRGLLGIPVLHG